jgi:hypothetical protein
MAKHSPSNSGGTSKFRMVVIDAELQDGEIGQLAQAIQGAFGGARTTTVRLNGPMSKSLLSPASGELPAEVDSAEVAEDVGTVEMEPAPPKPKVQKKIRTPNLDGNLHPGEPPSFKEYADARNVVASSPVLTKFLTVAAWLHEERTGTKVTADRAYTCFRFIEWPYNIDFDQPLRDLRSKNKFVELKPEDKGKGEFSVTHLGLAKADKMKTVK